MKHSSRLFSCALCLQQVVICSHCDRGNIYCSSQCAITARQKYCRAGNKRYQKTKKGQSNNALRQKRFRSRFKNKVTDHGSHHISKNALLLQIKNNAQKDVIRHCADDMKCCVCNSMVSLWLRHDFLRYYTKQHVRKLRYLHPT